MRSPGGIDPERLLEGLTDPQKQAVTTCDGPLLVLAGPGSGKTRVITRRAAYLAATTTPAHRILAITFTNKAASEMKDRIDSLGVEPGMVVATFHSFCARMIRVYHERIGISSNYSIFDVTDQKKAVKDAIKRCDLDEKHFSPAGVLSSISNAKNELLTAEEFEVEKATDFATRQTARIYHAYEQVLREQNAVDFDDLLLKFALLLSQDGEICRNLENRYSHVLIDEYQDTNRAQYEIAFRMTQERKNICATGDPDQSIYEWRGADIRNILDFETDYPDAVTVKLEQNYRSTKRILLAADALIEHNEDRKPKTLWTDNDDGSALRVMTCESDKEESAFVASEILKYLSSGRPASDIAIFYRINALSRGIEESLLKNGIPYQVARGTEFYNRKEIKDLLAYLRVIANPSDETALLRIINTPARGIGTKSVQRLFEMAREQGIPVFDLIAGSGDLSGIGRSAAKVEVFRDMMRQFQEYIDLSPKIAVEKVLNESGLHAEYKGDDEKIENLLELVNAAAAFQENEPDGSLLDFLQFTSLVSDVDEVEADKPTVTLMTLHAAKGLEFPVVFIVGLEDGILPLIREDEIDSKREEEERRLLFVGITRAMEELVMSRAMYRMRYGRTERSPASKFLYELPDDEIEWLDQFESKKTQSRSWQDADTSEFKVGDLVRHPRHGRAMIRRMARTASGTNVRILCEDGQERTVMLEFSDLERLDEWDMEYD